MDVKYVVCWREDDGQWKWRVDIWNTNVPSSPGRNSRDAARARFAPRARRAEEVDAGHLRRRATKLSGQILPAQWVATAPGSGFVSAPVQCPASPASLLLAGSRAALATRPTGVPPRIARALKIAFLLSVQKLTPGIRWGVSALTRRRRAKHLCNVPRGAAANT